MATDTLEIFGTEYTGVTGIKATDDQSGTKTYIRPQGTKSITQNGTGIDVVEYASVDVAVPSSSPTVQSLTVTPSASQQTFNSSSVDGYKPVTVNAIPSEYIIPTGNKAITENGTGIDVAQYSTVSVSVSGGGGANVDTKTMTNSSATNTSIQFTGLSGEPKWFCVRCTSQLTRSSNSSYYYVTMIRYNETNHNGNYWRMSNGTFYNDTSHYSHSYSNGTLTLSSSGSRSAAGGSFYNGGYELVYVY